METQGDRYKFIRERAGLSKQEFARSLGIQQSLSSYIESGAREASREVLQRLASIYKVNLNWFLSGESESFFPEDVPGGVVMIEHIRQEAAAGRGVEIEDNAEIQNIPVPRVLLPSSRPEVLRAVTVRGDSMVEKEIFDRDIVIYNPLDTGGDCISVVSLAGQLLVKHVVVDRLAGTVTLVSANKMYPPRVISGEDLSNVKIEGKVVVCMHRMP